MRLYRVYAVVLAALFPALSGANCHGQIVVVSDPPDEGTLILELARAGRAGLQQVGLDVQRIDLLYGSVPPVSQTKADDEDEEATPNTVCNNVPGDFSSVAGPVVLSINFPTGPTTAQQLVAVPAPVGSIQEVRIIYSSPSATFQTGSAEVTPGLVCSDATYSVPNGDDRDGGHHGDDDKKDMDKDDLRPLGVLRIIPKAGAFDISKDAITTVRALLDAKVNLVPSGSDDGEADQGDETKPDGGKSKSDDEGGGTSKTDDSGDQGQQGDDEVSWVLEPNLPGEVVPQEDTNGIIANEWYVLFTKGTTQADRDALNASVQAQIIQPMALPDIEEWIEVPSNLLIQDVVSKLASNPHVLALKPTMLLQKESAAPYPNDYLGGFPFATGEDPGFDSDQERFNKVGAVAAWKDLLASAPTPTPPAGLVGDHKTLLVIADTGVDFSNPDLIPNIAINQSEVPASVQGRVFDCDGDGVLTFIDLNWDVYFPGVNCTAGVSTSTGAIFATPPPDAQKTPTLNNDPTICDRGRHQPFDLCDPGDIVSGRPASCPSPSPQTCSTWEDGVAPDGTKCTSSDLFCDAIVGWVFANQQATSDRDGLVRAGVPPNIVAFNYPHDTDGHGTAVASVAAAARGQGGTLGIAWNQAIVPAKVREAVHFTDVMLFAGQVVKASVVNWSLQEIPPISDMTPKDCLPKKSLISGGSSSANQSMLDCDKQASVAQWQAAASVANNVVVVSSTIDCLHNLDTETNVFTFPGGLRSLLLPNNQSWITAQCNMASVPPLLQADLQNLVAVGAVNLSTSGFDSTWGPMSVDLLAPDRLSSPASGPISVDPLGADFDASGNALASVVPGQAAGVSVAAPQVAAAAALAIFVQPAIHPVDLLSQMKMAGPIVHPSQDSSNSYTLLNVKSW